MITWLLWGREVGIPQVSYPSFFYRKRWRLFFRYERRKLLVPNEFGFITGLTSNSFLYSSSTLPSFGMLITFELTSRRIIFFSASVAGFSSSTRFLYISSIRAWLLSSVRAARISRFNCFLKVLEGIQPRYVLKR